MTYIYTSDPATIASSLGTLLTPYFKKAGEDFVGEAGKLVQEKAKVLWQKLRGKLDSHPDTKEALDHFEKSPETYSKDIKARIEDKVAKDKPMADEIASDLEEIKRNAPYVRVVQKMIQAEGVIGVKAKQLKSGTVDVDQEMQNAKNVTGVDFDEIG